MLHRFMIIEEFGWDLPLIEPVGIKRVMYDQQVKN